MITIKNNNGELNIKLSGYLVDIGDEFIGGIVECLKQIAQIDEDAALTVRLAMINAIAQMEFNEAD